MDYAATVAGGLFPTNGVSSIAQVGRSFVRRRVAQALGLKGAMELRELMDTLNGVVAGSAAVKTYGRVQANTELGGVRTVENESIINRNSAAADKTEIAAEILTMSTRTYTTSPVPNLDGNPLGTR